VASKVTINKIGEICFHFHFLLSNKLISQSKQNLTFKTTLEDFSGDSPAVKLLSAAIFLRFVPDGRLCTRIYFTCSKRLPIFT